MKKIDCSLKKNRNNKLCKKKCSIGEGQFSIILPKKDNSGRPIKPKNVQKYIAGVNKIFGGSTTIPITKGCYTEGDKFFCEEGIQISGVRDFDGKYASSEFKKMGCSQRKKQLENDYKELKKLAEKSAGEFGQDSVMVVYDNIADASFIGDNYKKQLPKNMLGKKKIFDYKED